MIILFNRYNTKYSKYYNWRHGRTGHVFEGHYKSIVVQDTSYLLSLLRYIHRNPVKASMCKNVEDYRWSSDYYYRKYPYGFIETSFIMEMLADNYEDSIKLYKNFMSEDIKDEEAIFETVGNIGESSLVEMINKTDSIKRPYLDQILRDVGINDQEYELIKNGSRIRSLTSYKINYVQASIKYQYTLKEIGENIGLKQSAIHKLKS